MLKKESTGRYSSSAPPYTYMSIALIPVPGSDVDRSSGHTFFFFFWFIRTQPSLGKLWVPRGSSLLVHVAPPYWLLDTQ
jgi:hypothetical protein